MSAQRGFTLIEMLVVVAIIAVLCALGIPAWQSAKASARRAECQSNLKQIYTGLVNYAAENNNMLPAAYAAGGTGQEASWGYQIWPYIYGSINSLKYPENCLQMGTPVYAVCPKNVFRCPATKEKAIKVPTAQQVSPPRFSYGLNCSPALLPGMTSSSALPIPFLSVPTSTSTAMVTEDSFPIGNGYTYLQSYGLIPHSGGSNVLFFDGHVDWMALASFPTSPTDPFWTGRAP